MIGHALKTIFLFMKNIYDHIGRPSIRHQPIIGKLTEPLSSYFGIDRFWRSELAVDGTYSLVGSHPASAEIFFGSNDYQGHPFFRHPKFFQSGYIMPEQSKSTEYEQVQERLREKGSCFHHVLINIRQEAGGFVEYGFASSKLMCGLESTYLNNLNLIDRFIEQFDKSALKVIKEARDDYSINIAGLIGNMYLKKPQINEKAMDRDRALKFLMSIDGSPERSKLLGFLSKSERLYLKHYLLGKTTKEIAKTVYRSPRTIEKHLENAKGKLGINTRAELFHLLQPFKDVL